MALPQPTPSNIRKLKSTRHFTMIEDDVLEEVLRTCGLAAMGLYAYLERKANPEGQCWPPMSELMDVTGSSDRYLRELINGKLVPAGFVQRREVRNRFNRTERIIYTLPYHKKPDSSGAEQGAELPPEQGEEPESQTSSAKVSTEYPQVAKSKSLPPTPQPDADASDRASDLIPSEKVEKPKRAPRHTDAKPAPGFDAFYAAYPRKQSKPDAIRAWNTLAPDDALQSRILTAITQHKQSRQWNDENGRYIPLPASWLNKQRWEDVLTIAVNEPPPATTRDHPADGGLAAYRERQRRGVQ